MLSNAVQKWIDKARNDLLWTEGSLNEKIYYGACFSAQQAVEKALKGFLLSQGKVLRKIHDLGAILEECIKIDSSFETVREDVIPLVDYYIQTRYPDMGDLIEYTQEKAVQALENGRKIVTFVENKIIKVKI